MGLNKISIISYITLFSLFAIQYNIFFDHTAFVDRKYHEFSGYVENIYESEQHFMYGKNYTESFVLDNQKDDKIFISIDKPYLYKIEVDGNKHLVWNTGFLKTHGTYIQDRIHRRYEITSMLHSGLNHVQVTINTDLFISAVVATIELSKNNKLIQRSKIEIPKNDSMGINIMYLLLVYVLGFTMVFIVIISKNNEYMRN
jgi:hypothetical protein